MSAVLKEDIQLMAQYVETKHETSWFIQSIRNLHAFEFLFALSTPTHPSQLFFGYAIHYSILYIISERGQFMV